MKSYYAYALNGEIIAHGADVDTLRADLVKVYYWENNEPDADLHELTVDTWEDSLYISEWSENFGEDPEVFSIIDQCGYNLVEWEYIETEFVGDGKYRTIFHKI